jgi:predicted transcriptional regulator
MNKKSNSEKRETLTLPLKVLQDRDVAILESIVEYLKEEKKLKYSEIAKLLNRDQRTIWTVYNRVKKKRLLLKKVIK